MPPELEPMPVWPIKNLCGFFLHLLVHREEMAGRNAGREGVKGERM
jgi:hypothetical protein